MKCKPIKPKPVTQDRAEQMAKELSDQLKKPLSKLKTKRLVEFIKDNPSNCYNVVEDKICSFKLF